MFYTFLMRLKHLPGYVFKKVPRITCKYCLTMVLNIIFDLNTTQTSARNRHWMIIYVEHLQRHISTRNTR